jgi:hypothetical protein
MVVLRQQNHLYYIVEVVKVQMLSFPFHHYYILYDFNIIIIIRYTVWNIQSLYHYTEIGYKLRNPTHTPLPFPLTPPTQNQSNNLTFGNW